MGKAILIDFGSTFTKAAAVDMETARILCTVRKPSTVSTDAGIGLKNCLEEIEHAIGKSETARAAKLAASSAAGGLRMAVCGLTPTLSIVAGKNAAYGAGAKIMKVCTGWMTEDDIEELENANLEIILLCGGYEGGNTTMVLHNAELLARSNSCIPVIFSGNSEIQNKVKILFQQAGKECFVAENILPDVGIVNAEPVEEVIRRIFLDRIVNMKGLDKIRGSIDRLVMPTPAAVLAAGELLAQGTEREKGAGGLMIIDIGGATTDIHSFCYQTAAEGARCVGTPEPYAKRTVEGDLGMRESSGLVFEEIGWQKAAADLNTEEEILRSSVEKRMKNIKFLPEEDPEHREFELSIDQMTARYASRLAVRRHAGRIESTGSPFAPKLQYGKNLENIRWIIGTGGCLIGSSSPEEILSEACATRRDQERGLLLPKEIQMAIDGEYILYAAGLLRSMDPDAAFALMRNSLRRI